MKCWRSNLHICWASALLTELPPSTLCLLFLSIHSFPNDNCLRASEGISESKDCSLFISPKPSYPPSTLGKSLCEIEGTYYNKSWIYQRHSFLPSLGYWLEHAQRCTCLPSSWHKADISRGVCHFSPMNITQWPQAKYFPMCLLSVLLELWP